MAPEATALAGQSAQRCPCGSKEVYASCCGRLHGRFVSEGALSASTAEALMRSRYTAFALAADGDFDRAAEYLLATWTPETRPAEIALSGPGSAEEPSLRWVRLEIEGITDGGPFDDAGTVTFIAHFRTPAGGRAQHETSRFIRRHGTWLYRDGSVE